MTENPATPPAAAPANRWDTPFWRKTTRWVTILAAIIIGGTGLMRLYASFTPQMPACDASETTDVIRSIYTGKNITLTKLSDMKVVSETSAERNCQAHIETAGETATIDYRITLQGKQFQVQITKVDAHPRG